VRQVTNQKFAVVESTPHQGSIDLVVPFTTPELTRAALDAANRMGTGLNAALRLIKIQIVPVQLDLCQSPVGINFLKEQLSTLRPDLPAARELRFARDFKEGLESALTPDSLVVLATLSRPWRTRQEQLAASLRRDGFRVVLVPTGTNWTRGASRVVTGSLADGTDAAHPPTSKEAANA
jgi:hypothetical protein